MTPVASPASASTCPVCHTSLDANGTCPRCRAPEDWNDQIEAVDFILRRFRDWFQDGQLSEKQLNALLAHYEKRKADMQAARDGTQPFVNDPAFPARDYCWSCEHYLYKSSSHCHECGAPVA